MVDYIIVNDIQGNHRRMTIDIFQGILFKWVYGMNYLLEDKKVEVGLGEASPTIKIRKGEFKLLFKYEIQQIIENCYVIDILDGYKVAYRVRLYHQAPKSIENYIRKSFMQECFQ